MRHVIIFWILVGVELAQSNDELSKDTEQPMVQTAQTNNPSVTKRFLWHAPQSHSREDPYKRGSRPDRFRFFHQGLGKRTVPIESAEIKEHNDLFSKNSHASQTMKKLIKDVVADYVMQSRYDTSNQVSADPFLERTPTYRTLESLNYLYANKRAPEVFSETLYPIQAGKQQLEVTLDRSLNDKQIDEFGYDIGVDDENALDDYDTEVEDVNDIPLESEDTEVTKTPYDLIFGSPDLDNSDLYRTYGKPNDITDNVDDNRALVEDKDTSNMNEGRTKRWWAAEKFRRFRTAKSWDQFGGRGKHIDPAIYFIGLGK